MYNGDRDPLAQIPIRGRRASGVAAAAATASASFPSSRAVTTGSLGYFFVLKLSAVETPDHLWKRVERRLREGKSNCDLLSGVGTLYPIA